MLHRRVSVFSWTSLIAVTLLPFSAFCVLSACSPNHLAPGAEETTHEGDEPSPPELSSFEKSKLEAFTEPTADPAHQQVNQQINEVMRKYANIDPKAEVPAKLLQTALAYFDANKAHAHNANYLSIVDFSKNSSAARLYIISMDSGSVWKLHVAHGKNSDAGNDGFAEKFSNANGSEMSSLGFYVTAETYTGKHGLSLRLDGVSSTNSNARKRAIVMHGASYVYDADKKAGRSWGCLAIPEADRDQAIKILKNGSIIYAGQSG